MDSIQRAPDLRSDPSKHERGLMALSKCDLAAYRFISCSTLNGLVLQELAEL